MKIKDAMSTDCMCIAPDATLLEAARRMRELDVGPLPVCANERIAGMLTDRDIVLRAVAAGRDPKTTRVRDVMTPSVTYCFEDQEIDDAAQLMQEQKIRRLVVLDHDKHLVGILSLGDIAVAGDDMELAATTLERISEPATPAP